MIWLGGCRFLWRRASGGERLSRPFQQAVRCPGAAAPTPTARRTRAGAARAPFSRLAPPSSTALPPTAHPRGRGAPRRRVRRDGERVGAPSGRRAADGPPVEPRGAERAQRTTSFLQRTYGTGDVHPLGHESNGKMRSNLLIQQPPKGATPQHGVSALSSHASSSRLHPAARGCSRTRRQRRLILGEATMNQTRWVGGTGGLPQPHQCTPLVLGP